MAKKTTKTVRATVEGMSYLRSGETYSVESRSNSKESYFTNTETGSGCYVKNYELRAWLAAGSLEEVAA